MYSLPFRNQKCDLCPAPATIAVEDMDGITVSTLCDACYRRENHREPPRQFLS